jgi:hypothetical protein
MIRVDLPDQTTTNQLIEALYVAAGAREGTVRATQWRRLARAVEAALDNLAPDAARPAVPAATHRHRDQQTGEPT